MGVSTDLRELAAREIRKHMREVRAIIEGVCDELVERSYSHDRSKIGSDELDVFSEFTPKLRESTYGSEEYQGFLRDMKPALDHHYENNRHHPEHFEDGIDGMTLVDLVEMFADWLAATKRHADGDIRKSIEINAKRFAIPDQLRSILLNTVEGRE